MCHIRNYNQFINDFISLAFYSHSSAMLVCCVSGVVVVCCLLAVANATSISSPSDDGEQPQQQSFESSAAATRPDYSDMLPNYNVYLGSNEGFEALRLPQYSSASDEENANALELDSFSGGIVDGNDIGDYSAVDRRPAVKRTKSNNFMRFGRQPLPSSAFIRFGRAGRIASAVTDQQLVQQQQQQLPAKADNFMRFGRARGTAFMRFGRNYAAVDEEGLAGADKRRFNRRGDNHIRFGKRAGGQQRDGAADAAFMRALRSNAVMIPAAAETGKERNLVATETANGQLDAADGLNRMERSDKQFIRFGRGDKAFARLLAGKPASSNDSGDRQQDGIVHG